MNLADWKLTNKHMTVLFQMGQDLWGKSAAVGRTPPGLGAGAPGSGSGWPTSTSNGWGSNGTAAADSGANGWLLIKNLTPQVNKSCSNESGRHNLISRPFLYALRDFMFP